MDARDRQNGQRDERTDEETRTPKFGQGREEISYRLKLVELKRLNEIN